MISNRYFGYYVILVLVTMFYYVYEFEILQYNTIKSDNHQNSRIKLIIDIIFNEKMNRSAMFSRTPEKKIHSNLSNKFDVIDSNILYSKVRIICWILTCPANREAKAIHVKATWGKRCNKLIFMSSETNDTLPSVDLGVEEGRKNLWGKTRRAFKYIYNQYPGEYDWVLKADDDTYVIMENLRYMLSIYDADSPIYFGSNYRKFAKNGYMSGGGGYVLSREATKKFVLKALPNTKLCAGEPAQGEDVEIGKCLGNIGVMAGDSRDHKGRGRFFPFGPLLHLFSDKKDPKFWYWDYIKYPTVFGPECCSKTVISFHYIEPKMMHAIDFFLYYAKVAGRGSSEIEIPPKLPPDIDAIPFELRNQNLTEIYP